MIIEKQTIRLRQLEFYAYHGVLPQERTVGGRYVVDLALEIPLDASAVIYDDLKGTVNYAEVYEVVKSTMEQPTCLLENVAARILCAVMTAFPTVVRATVEVCKVNPPMGAACQGASVEMTIVRDGNDGIGLK